MQPDLSKLSLQQHEIMRLLGKELSDEDIATRLSISIRGLSVRKQLMVERLGLKDIAELVRIAARTYL